MATLIEKMVEQAEIDRAKLEGRKPDLENPAGIAGVELNVGESVTGEFGDQTPAELLETPVAEEVVDEDDDDSEDDE